MTGRFGGYGGEGRGRWPRECGESGNGEMAGMVLGEWEGGDGRESARVGRRRKGECREAGEGRGRWPGECGVGGDGRGRRTGECRRGTEERGKGGGRESAWGRGGG